MTNKDMQTSCQKSTKPFIKSFSSNFNKSNPYKMLLTTHQMITYPINVQYLNDQFKLDDLVLSEEDVILLIKSLGFKETRYESKTDLAFQLWQFILQVSVNEIIIALIDFKLITEEEKIERKEWLKNVETHVKSLSNN